MNDNGFYVPPVVNVPEWPVEEVTLQKLRVGMTRVLRESQLYDPKVDLILNAEFSWVEVALSGSLLKLGDGKKVTVQYPADWWQAFKKRWFPNWMLDKWPVQNTVHTITAEAIFPEAKKYLFLEEKVGPSYLTLYHLKEP